MKRLNFIFVLLFCFSSLFADPAELKFLKRGYPDAVFECKYDSVIKDYLITVKLENKKADFYWAEGRMLPKEELANKNKYRSLFYKYNKQIPDPKDFTKEDIKRIKDYTSSENRKNGAGLSYFFYDFIYDSAKRGTLEKNLVKTTFLGKGTNIHKRILTPLKKVETKVLKLAKSDAEVKKFVDNLSRADSYNWREISDSGKKSVHSMGIAIDILPIGWGQKNLYWSWRRDIDKENWMLLPLDRRWLVPDKVVKIFEEEGFIYGAKWIVWDNMHFEYFPEVILYNE